MSSSRASSPLARKRLPALLHHLLPRLDYLLHDGLTAEARRHGRLLVFGLGLLGFLTFLFLVRAWMQPGLAGTPGVVLLIQFAGLAVLVAWLRKSHNPAHVGSALVLGLCAQCALLTLAHGGTGILAPLGLLAFPALGLLLATPRIALAAALMMTVALMAPQHLAALAVGRLPLAELDGLMALSMGTLLIGVGGAGWGYAAFLDRRLQHSYALLRLARRMAHAHRAPLYELRLRALRGVVRLERAHQARLDAALAEVHQQREELEQLKHSLLANLSHEIRTPLTGILGYVGILEDLLDNPERALAAPIRTNAEQLLETLNTLITLAEFEQETRHYVPQPLVAADHVDRMVRTFRPRAHAKGLRFDVHIENPEACARLDPSGLDTILFHLLSNAVKFTEQGGILLEVRADADWVHLCVRDTGIGIEPSFLPHLFEPFRQASSGETRRFRGNGVGLSLVHKMVTFFGGQITVASVPGEGSIFTVRFPRVEAPALRPPHGLPRAA